MFVFTVVVVVVVCSRGSGTGSGGSRLCGLGRLLHVPVLHGGQGALESIALGLVLQHRERSGQETL